MKKLLLIIPIITLLAACGGNLAGNSYNESQVGQAQMVRYGTIVQMRPVQIAGGTETGTLAGAAVGGTAGSLIGGTTQMNIIGAVGGAVLGGMAGHATEGQMTKQTGMQYFVRLNGGRTISVIQSLDEPMQVGQRVMVLTGTNARDRVIPDYGNSSSKYRR